MAHHSHHQRRQRPGTPIGGEFAQEVRPYADTQLLDPDVEPKPDLPPGVTEDDDALFTRGQCHALADAISARTGWEVVVLSDGPDGVVGWVHAGVRTPNGTIVDVRGEHDELDWLDQWAEMVDSYGEKHDAYDGGNVAIYPATDHGWTRSGYSEPHDPQVWQRAQEVAQLVLDHVTSEPAPRGSRPASTPAAQSPADLLHIVERGLDEDPANYLARVNQHLRGMNAVDYERDFFHPMARAIWRGDRDRALELAVKAFSHDEREARWKNDPDFTPPSIDIVDRDDMYGAKHIGSKYQPGRPLREVAKDVRADIKKAVAAGYLPDLDYRVRTTSKGSPAITVVASGMPDEDCYNAEVTPYSLGHLEMVPSDRARIAQERIRGIVGQYARQQSNGLVDYWNHSFWIDTQVRSVSDAAVAKASEEEWALRSKVRLASSPEEKNRLSVEHLAARARRGQAESDRKRVRARIIERAR